MGKCTALWNKSGGLKSAEVMNCQLRLPCPTRWNSLYDSLAILIKHKTKLHQFMAALDLPTLKAAEVKLLTEYIDALILTATATDRLQ